MCYEEQTDRRKYTKTVEALQGHVKKTMKHPEDLASLFVTECRMPVLVRPPKPVAAPPAPAGDGDTAAADTEDIEADIELWKEDLRALSKRKSVLRGNLSAIHAVIWGQCSEAMNKAKLKSLNDYAISAEQDNCEWFLRTINAITMQFDAKHNGYMAMLDATASFLNCRQHQAQTVSNYMETLKSHVDTIEYHGGTVVLNQNLAPDRSPDGVPLSQAERTKIARDSTLAAAHIRGADKTRFGTLITNLDNQFSNGRDEYPTDLTSAYGLLISYKTPTNATRQTRVSNYNNEEASVGTQATTTTAERVRHSRSLNGLPQSPAATAFFMKASPVSDATPLAITHATVQITARTPARSGRHDTRSVVGAPRFPVHHLRVPELQHAQEHQAQCPRPSRRHQRRFPRIYAHWRLPQPRRGLVQPGVDREHLVPIGGVQNLSRDDGYHRGGCHDRASPRRLQDEISRDFLWIVCFLPDLCC